MKKICYLLTLCLVFVLCGVNNGSAQEVYLRGVGYAQNLADATVKNMQRVEQFIFDNADLTLENDQSFKVYKEHLITSKGKTTRLKFVFDNKVVNRIVVETYGESTPQDIENGVFTIEIKPKKTQVVKSTIYRNDNKTETHEQKVLVLKYEEHQKAYILINQYQQAKNTEELNKYIESLFQKHTPKKK